MSFIQNMMHKMGFSAGTQPKAPAPVQPREEEESPKPTQDEVVKGETFDPNNLGSARDIELLKKFQKVEGEVQNMANAMKEVDEKPGVDLNPGQGKVAVENLAIDKRKYTGIAQFDSHTGTPKKLELKSKLVTYQGPGDLYVDILEDKVGFQEQGDTKTYERYSRRAWGADYLKEDNRTTEKFIVDNKTGSITYIDNKDLYRDGD